MAEHVFLPDSPMKTLAESYPAGLIEKKYPAKLDLLRKEGQKKMHWKVRGNNYLVQHHISSLHTNQNEILKKQLELSNLPANFVLNKHVIRKMREKLVPRHHCQLGL